MVVGEVGGSNGFVGGVRGVIFAAILELRRRNAVLVGGGTTIGEGLLLRSVAEERVAFLPVAFIVAVTVAVLARFLRACGRGAIVLGLCLNGQMGFPRLGEDEIRWTPFAGHRRDCQHQSNENSSQKR